MPLRRRGWGFAVALVLMCVFTAGSIPSAAMPPYVMGQIIHNTTISENLGTAVATSADGNTVAVGQSPGFGTNGEVFVYARNAGSYLLIAHLLNPTALHNGDFDGFGNALALNGDGTALLVGASGKASYAGAVYVYTRSGGGFSAAPIQTLTAPHSTPYDYFGKALALSGDGNTLLVAAPITYTDAGPDVGAAYVYTRGRGGYTLAVALADPANTQEDDFSIAVAMSGDGGMVLISALNNSHGRGAVYLYPRNSDGSFPSTPVHALTDPTPATSEFGFTLALSSDGSTLLIGAPFDPGTVGTVYGFTRRGDTYDYATTLASPDGAMNAAFGGALAVNGDGTALLVAATQDGIIYPYTRGAGVNWVGSGPFPFAKRASAVALSGDGSVALTGAPFGDYNAGEAYIYTSAVTPVTKLTPAIAAPVLRPGASLPLVVTATYADQSVGAARGLIYTGYNPQVIAVGTDGTLTGIAAGSTPLTITAPNRVAVTLTITVTSTLGGGLTMPAPQPSAAPNGPMSAATAAPQPTRKADAPPAGVLQPQTTGQSTATPNAQPARR